MDTRLLAAALAYRNTARFWRRLLVALRAGATPGPTRIGALDRV